ncbi:MAG TPA: TolC family protein [Terracidiphilus sp.]|nr:TolC family protein [Terracidiphilus sp.]
MAVNRAGQFHSRRATRPVLLAVLGLAVAAAPVCAQGPNPTSATNPFYGSVTVHPATDETLKLSLDEAISLGLKNNLGLKEAENGEKLLQGEKNVALQEFLPTIILSGSTGVYQHNLAALGFGPGVIGKFAGLFGGTMPAGFSFITRDDLTQGQVFFNETLFSGPVIAAYKGAGAAERAAHFAKMSARGEVVQQVATAYLHAIAAASEVDNTKALETEDQVLLDHAHAAHEAGTAANLDELRAKVQLQAQQQARILAENALEKDLILLKREIGVAPGQKVALTDPAPYSDLATQTPEEVRAVAYKNRQDYQNLQNQAVEYKAIHSAYRCYRLPTLSFGGYYAVSDVSGAGTHGNFVAQGTLSVPLFREAKLRGDVEASQAQMDAMNNQLADLRGHIDQQVRAALLDVNAASQLVQVARSNVDLATRALSDENERVNAGVDDNLPLVTAQATLASAQSNLVESLYQYNLSKLALARAAGILETQYREYLGR